MNPVINLLTTTLPYYLFFSSFLPAKPKLTKRKIVFGVLFASILKQLISNCIHQNLAGYNLGIVFANMVTTLCFLIWTVAFFMGKWYIKGFLIAVFCVLMCSIEVMMFFLFVMVKDIDSVTQDHTSLSGWTPAVAAVAVHMVVILIKIFRQRRESAGSRSAFLMQMIIPIISLLYMIYLNLVIVSNGLITTADWVNFCVLILINLSLYFMYGHMESVHRTNQEYQLAQQRQEMLGEYYRELEKHQHEIRTIKHDLKNKLLSVQGYVDSARHCEAAQQVAGMIEELAEAAALDFTRHAGLNAVLGAQYLQAQKDGILCQFQIRVPEDMAFAPEDLSAFLGNLLDNAREACLRHEGMRYLCVVLAYHNHALIVECENSTEGTVGSLRSGKSDPQNHGLGFASMRAVVEKYDGEMQYRAEPGRFCVEATLFEPNHNKEQSPL